MLPDIDRVTNIIRETAEAVILPRFRNLAEGEVRAKSHARDLVTVADLEAEKILSRRLPTLIPGSLVVGEEAAAQNPKVLDALSAGAPVWIVDPVDGTSNFAEGNPLFGVMVALVLEGRTVAGWIHDPLNDRTAIAAEGEGAFLAGDRLRIAAAPKLVPEMAGFMGNGRWKKMAGRVGRLVRIASAAHIYLRLAKNELDFALFTRLMPWDHAAGCLIQSEAGGKGATLDGEPYRPRAWDLEKGREAGDGLLLAPGAPSWQALKDAMDAA